MTLGPLQHVSTKEKYVLTEERRLILLAWFLFPSDQGGHCSLLQQYKHQEKIGNTKGKA